MAGFRNVAVHDYQKLNLEIVRSILVEALRGSANVIPTSGADSLDDSLGPEKTQWTSRLGGHSTR